MIEASAPIQIYIERWHPAKVNELLNGHWSKGHRLKKRDRLMVAAYSRGKKKADGLRRLQVTVILKKGQRGGDPDSYFKSLCDALKHAGMLVDDNRQGVELLPVLYERGSDMEWGTRIDLWEAGQPALATASKTLSTTCQ